MPAGACPHPCEETLSCSENKTGASTWISLILSSAYVVLKAYPSPSINNRENLLSRLLPERSTFIWPLLLLPRAFLSKLIFDRNGIRGMQSIHSFRQPKLYKVRYLALNTVVMVHWGGAKGLKTFLVLGVTVKWTNSWPIARSSWSWTAP